MNEMTQVPPAESGSEPSAVRPGLIEAWRDRVAYQALSLGLVCALVAVVLLLGNQLTRQRIVDAELQDRLAVLRQVLPQALYDNDPLADAFELEDAELGLVEVYPARRAGQLTATAFQVSTVGYGGPIVQLNTFQPNRCRFDYLLHRLPLRIRREPGTQAVMTTAKLFERLFQAVRIQMPP